MLLYNFQFYSLRNVTKKYVKVIVSLDYAYSLCISLLIHCFKQLWKLTPEMIFLHKMIYPYIFPLFSMESFVMVFSWSVVIYIHILSVARCIVMSCVGIAGQLITRVRCSALHTLGNRS